MLAVAISVFLITVFNEDVVISPVRRTLAGLNVSTILTKATLWLLASSIIWKLESGGRLCVAGAKYITTGSVSALGVKMRGPRIR